MLPATEETPIKKAESPYGNTKQINEEIIADTIKSGSPIKAILLRYFNPIGAHPTAFIRRNAERRASEPDTLPDTNGHGYP